jgi:hypothetical protein
MREMDSECCRISLVSLSHANPTIDSSHTVPIMLASTQQTRVLAMVAWAAGALAKFRASERSLTVYPAARLTAIALKEIK